MIKKVFKKFDDNKRNENLYMWLLLISILSFAVLYFNRAATDWEGPDNFCALLMKDGKMMYKDFFYYIPPVYILRCLFTWFLFDGEILPLRFLGIFERAILFLIIYKILVRWFKPFIVYIASFIGFLLYNSLTFNSYGDYTQYSQIFAALAVYFVIKFEENEKNNLNKALVWLGVASFFLIQSVMSKQSIGAAAIVFMFVALIVYSIIRKVGKRFWGYFLAVLSGTVAALLPYAIWLICNGALEDFVNQVFLLSLNSKGLATAKNTVKETSLIVRVWKAIFNIKSLVFDLGLLLFLIFKFYSEKIGDKKAIKWLRNISFIVFFLSGACLLKISTVLSNLINTVLTLWGDGILKLILLIIIIGFISLFGMKKGGSWQEKERNIIAFLAFGSFVSWIVVSCITTEQIKEILDAFKMGETLPGFYELFFHVTNVILLSELFRKKILKKNKYPLVVLFYLAVSNANAVISLIGGGSATFSANGSLFTVPLAIALLGKEFKFESKYKEKVIIKKRCTQYLNIAVMTISMFILSMVTMGQHLYVPYSWYGWASEPISDDTSYTIDFDRYTGMLVSKKTKVTLEEITKLVSENSTDEDEFVFSFPGGKIYNILANKINMPTNVVYYMFDVCPDNYAIKDAEILKEKMPGIIVWKELGEPVWETFEKQYRNGGRLGQREIQEWFNSVKETEYTLVGQVYNESVYVRNDGRNINYTSFVTEDQMISDRLEVEQNIHKSNVFYRLSEIITQYSSWVNVKFVYAVIIIMAILATLFSGKILRDTAMKMLLGILLLGYTLHISFVYFWAMSIPLLLGYFNKKKQIKKIDYIIYGSTTLAIILLCWQWTPAWSYIKFAFYSITTLIIISIFIEGSRQIVHKKVRGKV